MRRSAFSAGLARSSAHRKRLRCQPDAAGGNLTGFGLFDPTTGVKWLLSLPPNHELGNPRSVLFWPVLPTPELSAQTRGKGAFRRRDSFRKIIDLGDVPVPKVPKLVNDSQ